MARIACQVLQRGDRITFLWSDGAAYFEPYHLECTARAELLGVAAQIHGKLESAAVADLAQLGHQLYRALFNGNANPGAAAVEAWIGNLARTGGIERLEIHSDAPGAIPWSVVTETADQRGWGTRFPLGESRRVNALRSNLAVVNPSRLCLADLELTRTFSGDALDALTSLRDHRELAHTASEFAEAAQKRAPDVLLVLVRCASGALQLGSNAFTLRELRTWLDELKEGNPDPIVILMGAGDAAEQSAWLKIVDDAAATFSGLIANQALLPADKAFDVGARIARGFLDGQQNLGEVMKTIRQQGGAAEAFSAFCPLGLRVVPEGSADAPTPETVVENVPLPLRPYRPFAAYDDVDRALFYGREEDTIRAALTLDQAAGLILHGSPAVGKTSFLQAGLIPFLEQECVGYRVLRDRSTVDAAVTEREYPILILRCTSDLAGQFADALAVFCAQPLTYTTPSGNQVNVDLPGILKRTIGQAAPGSTAIQAAAAPTSISATPGQSGDDDDGPPPQGLTARDLWAALRDSKEALGKALAAITHSLPFELVIVVDQGEELITHVRSAQQQARRQKALEMLAYLSRLAPRCKVVFTIRSQALGQLGSAFEGGAPPDDWRAFYLRPLSESQMVDALLWPTIKENVLYTDEVPFQKYHFSFEEGLAQQIVADALEAAGPEQQSPLPMVQAIGSLLYEKQVLEKKQNAVRAADLKEHGGVRAALGKCLDLSLDRLKLSGATRSALRELIAKLYTAHDDGSVSRDLVHAGELKNSWKAGAEPVEPIVNNAAAEQGLFDIQQLLIGGQTGLYVSLPQDSLARLGQKINGEREKSAFARTKVLDVLWIMIPLVFAASAFTFWFTRNYISGAGDNEELRQKLAGAAEVFEKQKEEIRIANERPRRALYFGQLALAQQALQAGNARRAREILLAQPAMISYSEGKREKEDELRDRHRLELRGFEWRYLWRHLNSERHALLGHQGVVNAIAVSPDSQWAASASGDGTVRVWNLARGEALALLVGPKSAVHAVAFSPDGKTLASAGADKIVHLWDLSKLATDFVTLKEAKKLEGHTDAVHALAFGKDADTLASGGADKTVILWNQGAKKHTLSEHKAAVTALAIDADGKSLYSAGADGTLIAWDAAAGSKRQAIATPHQSISSIALAADGKTLATGGIDVKFDAEQGTIRFFAAADLKETGAAITHGTGVLSLAFRPDGKAIASGGKDHVIRLWDIDKHKEQHQWIGHLGGIRALAFAKDGGTLVSGDFEGVVKAWNPAQSSGPDVIAAHADWVQCLALHHTLLASGARDGTVKLWNPKDGKLIAELAKHTGAVTSLSFSVHRKKTLLAVGTRTDKNQGEIKIWQLEQDEKKGWQSSLRHTLTNHQKGVTCLAFHVDVDRADQLLSGSADQSVKLWDAEKGEEKESWKGHKDEVRCLAIASDAKSFVSGGKDGLLCYYEFGNKEVWPTEGLHMNSIDAVAFQLIPLTRSDDRPAVVPGLWTAGADLMMRLWVVEKEEKTKVDRKLAQQNFRSHNQLVTGMAVNQDLIASVGWDGAVVLHDRFQQRITLNGHEGPVRALAVATDQSFIATAGHDGTIRLWRAYQDRGADKK